MKNWLKINYADVIIAALAVFTATIHLVFSYNLEFHRDELLYFSLGQHPAFGYATVPPMIGWVAWAMQNIFGYSLFAVRIFPALVGAAMVFLISAIAKELGGSGYSRILATLGLLNKYLIGLLFFSFLIIIPFTQYRILFKDRKFWYGVLAGILVFSPNLIWQIVPDKKAAFIYCENYGQAGAITVIGKKYGLPEAICFSESFRYWIPEKFDPDITSMVYINDKPGDDVRQIFRKITKIGSISNPDAREFGTAVYLCEEPVDSFNKFWQLRIKDL